MSLTGYNSQMLTPVIIYEDNHLLIVQKPPGFLSQPDGGSRPNLLNWAEKYLARNKPGRAYVGLVHRLDRSVGGVMALAKTSKAAARLSGQFRDRSCEKIYLALVTGPVPGAGAGEWAGARLDDNLIRAGSLTRVAGPEEEGKICSLLWRMRAVSRNAHPGTDLALLQINLLTGFKHQIRAQLTGLGCPVVGDLKYGSPLSGPGPAIGLWAEALAIDHPTKKERLVFKADPAGDLWPWSLM